MAFTAFINWPGAPLTDSLVRRSLSRLSPGPTVVSSLSPDTNRPLLQWSTYDAIDHELTPSEPKSILSSSYTIRKALIEKISFTGALFHIQLRIQILFFTL